METLDSPRCFNCISAGLTGQTYRIAGKPNFKCATCKQITNISQYQPLDFQWKTKPEKWADSFRDKLEAQNNKVGLKNLKEIEKTIKESRK